jgi:tetratricopeptide (TPR) repeat protein
MLRPFGEGFMKKLTLVAGLLAASALTSFAYGAGDQKMAPAVAMPAAAPTNMGVMNMKMTLPPMPALYPEAGKPGAPVLTGYGDHHHPITTTNPQTQAFFDQGVRLLFAFNHAEAIRSFREAARIDPNCAMCWWGVAFALGPNINLPMQPDALAPAVAAVQMARSLEPHASPEEVDWIEAVSSRYSSNPKAVQHAQDESFAQAMGKVWAKHPDDLDAGTFYAEAMMDTQPWDYWQADGSTPKGHGAEIDSTLEGILKREPLHPGALHLYIHAVEASTTPERAEAAADKLEPLMPGAGHIVHMPSHIYFRVGRYADAVKVNTLAAQKDEQYIAACQAQGFYPLAYYSHNIHFLWTSSEMLGRYRATEDAAQRLQRAAAAGAPMAAGLPPVQLYLLVPVVNDIRFGKWNKALAEKIPAPDLKLDTAISHYARGFAFANKRRFKGATQERAQLAAMMDRNDFAAIDAFGVPGTKLAQLALVLLDGEIARVRGNTARALTEFKQANNLYNAIPYTEPDYWYQPVSHIYGAALLAAHKPAEAEAVYRESLKDHRIDGWALFGLAQALEAQGKTAEAAQTRKQFAAAWQMADVKLTSSRF